MTEKIKVVEINRTVVKEGRSFQVLKQISFGVQPGETVCILGPSGCGKSTLLRIIGGFDRPDSGKVLVDGEELKDPSPAVILVFQDFNQLFPWKTVIENITYPLRINKLGADEKERESEAIRSLKLVGLEDSYKAYPHQLSGGMKQKAALARALAMKPSVLLMDEPFGSLDALTRHKMQVLLSDIWKKTGVTIVFVTHDVQESIILGDKIIIMGDSPGEILRIVQNSLERPRDIGSKGFAGMYKEVCSLLEKAKA